MLISNIAFCLLLVNFFLSFSYGDQTGLHEGENEGEPGNQIEQKYCREEESLTPYNEPQIGAQTQIETHSETNVKSEQSIKTQSSDDTNSEQCSKESQRHGNVDKSQKEQVMDNGDQTVLREGGNEGEAGNQIEGNNPSKNVNYEKRDSRKEVSMTPDSEPKIGPQTPEKIQADMDKHSESTANTYDIISGDISKESQVLGNVEISKKGQTKDIIKISRNKFDKEFEVSDNPVSIGKRDTESLLPVVAGGKQRLSRQPYGFFFQKEPLTCQPQIKGTKKEKDFKKALIEEKKNEQKSDVSRKGVSAPKQQHEKKFKVNYASKQCGATIEEKNPEAENVNHIITTNKDEYLNNPCAANKKWFVIKLCETIYVKQIETGSFEFYSSQPRDISVDVSDRYPAKEYHSLGVFQLTESRKLHRFEIKKGDNYPVKYVRVEMLTYYGEEHFCPLTCFKVYGKPVELDAYDGDHEGKYSRDDIEESNPLNTGAKKVTDANYASSSQKIEPSEPTAEKTNEGSVFYYAVIFFFVFAVVVLIARASDSTSGNRSLPYNQGPNAIDSESTIRSANHVGNTILPHDSKHDGNRVFTDKEVNGDFIYNQDIEEDSAPFSNPWPTGTLTLQSREKFATNDQSQKRVSAETITQTPGSLQSELDSTSGNICSPQNTPPSVNDSEITSHSANQDETYDILLLHAEEDRDFAMELRQQLVKNSISDTCTRFLDVILIEEFIPEVQSEISTIEYVFKRCKYLFVLVTSNLKDDPRKRFLGELALIESIQNRRDGVIPIWAEHGARNLIFELKPFKGIDCTQKQINFQLIKILFKRHYF